MKPTGGPQKLRFTVHACSGEDSDYPVRELLFHSPQTRGWQSPRFCKYPQEVVLRLEHTSKVQQIQILSHEYKIATRVEVFVGAPSNPADADPNSCVFKRLGYLSFDSNERSSHQARELKSVHVNVPALLIRLVVHRCHVNKLNIYNQVGVIALNLIGERIAAQPEGPPGFLQLHPPVTREQPYYNAAAADMADLNLDIHVDTVTAAKIRDLARQKEQAVSSEDYDTAKAIKASIDRLKVVGQKIAQLEARKRAAVEKEDYDTAKSIKIDIDKLRAAGEGAAMMDAQPRSRNPDEIFNRVLGSKAGGSSFNNNGSVPVQSPPAAFDEQPVRGGAGPSAPSSPMERPEVLDLPEEASYAARPLSGGLNATARTHQAYDERPAMGKGRYAADEQLSSPGGAPQRPQEPVSDGLPAPRGWPGDLPTPEPLSGATAKDAEGLEELAGEYVARAFFSKNWQLRDAALGYLAKQLQQGELAGRSDAFRTLCRIMQRAMRDKVANVYLSGLALMPVLLDTLGEAAGGREVESAAESALPLLLDKLGDTNTRLKDASKEAIMFLVGLRAAGVRQHTSVIVKPIKNQTAWRPVLGILALLQDLVPLLGISKTGDGFDLPELMDFVGRALNSPNADVRSTALRVIKEVHDLVGPAIRKFMPKDITGKIKEQVEAVLGGDALAPAPAAPPPPPPPPAREKSSKAKAPAPKSAGRGGPKAAAAAAAPPPPPPPPPAEAEAADDPAAFEAELRSRERAHGASHPDVAESCSNLAILYNQRGECDKALPLYERALKIYESHYGPDHPEVAHTLTDLAVLHLEQGREGVGRPLLERALAIQTKALGPSHPDVLAIKDVLNSE